MGRSRLRSSACARHCCEAPTPATGNPRRIDRSGGAGGSPLVKSLGESPCLVTSDPHDGAEESTQWPQTENVDVRVLLVYRNRRGAGAGDGAVQDHLVPILEGE